MTIKKTSSDILSDKIWHNIRKGQIKNAEVLVNELNQNYPDYSSGWYAASFIAFKSGDGAKAKLMIDKALVQSPDIAQFIFQKALALDLLGQVSDAVAVALSAIEKSRNDPELLSEIGSFLSYCEVHDQAEVILRRAVNLKPDEPRFLYNLASVLRFVGNIEETEVLYDKAIKLAPHDYEAYYNRTELRQQTSEKNHIKELEYHLANKAKSWQDKMLLNYSLAKEFEDVGLYELSISHLSKGSYIRRKNMDYSVKGDLETIDKIIKVFDTETFKTPGKGYISEQPIFIIGLPRTGTTLVERMLSNHTEVVSVGESNSFATELVKQIQEITVDESLSRLELVERSKDIDYCKLGESYVKSTRPKHDDSLHFIDKLPLNFLYTGLIHLALPDSRLIHVTRNPMDTCYAIYKRLFKGAYPFSYELEELGKYYLAYSRLMDHWHQLLPGKIFKISYEELISDPETQLRYLLDFCGLSWQDSCLNFQSNPQPTTTASASQVRQPIYKTSIGKWKNYRKSLEPLIQILENGSITISN